MYAKFNNFKQKQKIKENTVQYKLENDDKYNSYDISEDCNITHKPGKIYIKDNYNCFINVSGEIMLMEKDIIYNIPTEFNLEIINVVKGKNIRYYYISNN